MAPRLAAGVALVLLVGVLVWSVGGDAPMERAVRGDGTAESAREGDGSVAIAPTADLAAAERPVEARTSLDDRRTWSATLAFAPDMAWLAPQLVWRVRAAGGDSDDVVEPLAPLPSDSDGDGAIELALRAPPERAGERVVLDLHLGDGSEFCVATLDVPEDGARVAVDWSRAPLVAAGTVLPIEAASRATLAFARGRHEPKERGVDAVYSVLPNDPSVRGFVREVRGPRGEFALLGSFVLGPGGGRDGEWSLGLVEERDALCDPVTVRTGATGVVLVIERNRVRIALALDPDVFYPGLLLRVDDRAGRIALHQNLDSLKQRAVDGRCVVEVPTAAGSGAFAVVEVTRVSVPLFETGFTVVPFQAAADGSGTFPGGGPHDCTRDLRIATLVVPAGNPSDFSARWIVGEEQGNVTVIHDVSSRRGSSAALDAPRTFVFAVPVGAERLVVESLGWTTQEIPVWSSAVRELAMVPRQPARVRIAWSGPAPTGTDDWVDLMFTTYDDSPREESPRLRDSIEVRDMFSLRFANGTDTWMEFASVDGEVSAVAAYMNAREEAEVEVRLVERGMFMLRRVVRIVDITCDGVSCVVSDDAEHPALESKLRVRFESGRNYVVHLGEVIEAPRER